MGSRVEDPTPCRDAALTELHVGHPGVMRMKSLARMYVWWPNMSSDIERTVRQCPQRQLNQSTPQVAPVHHWSWPKRPWTRLHLDYADPLEGKMVLILIDTHSKWIEAVHTSNATSGAVIVELRTPTVQVTRRGGNR